MANLAINGRAPAVAQPLGKRWPIWGDEERRQLNDVLESGKWWRGGYDDPAQSKVGQFEEAFALLRDRNAGALKVELVPGGGR